LVKPAPIYEYAPESAAPWIASRSLSSKAEARAAHGSPGGAKHRPDGAGVRGAVVLTCPAGKSVRCLSSPIFKNIPVFAGPKSPLELPPSRPTEGRFAIVTDAGRDAVDAAVSLTNGTQADGEVVWS
jgi:hypothetical protein